MISVSQPSTKRLPSMKRLSLKPKFWISSQELIRGNTVTTLMKPCLDVMVILNWSLVAFLLGMQKGAYFGMQSVRDRLVPVSFETRHVCSGLLFLRWLWLLLNKFLFQSVSFKHMYQISSLWVAVDATNFVCHSCTIRYRRFIYNH